MLLDSILNIGSKIIDKIFPDKEKADQVKLELLKLEQAGQFKELETELEQSKVDAADRSSARDRETKFIMSGKRDWIPPILAILTICGTFIITLVLIFSDIDADVSRPLDIILGALVGNLITIMNYYFGTSASSRQKDGFIEKLTSMEKDE